MQVQELQLELELEPRDWTWCYLCQLKFRMEQHSQLLCPQMIMTMSESLVQFIRTYLQNSRRPFKESKIEFQNNDQLELINCYLNLCELLTSESGKHSYESQELKLSYPVHRGAAGSNRFILV